MGDNRGNDVRSFRVRKVRIHGYDRAFVMAGQGPALLLLHGIGMNHKTWLPVLPQLARSFTVIAPDLLGHGESDKPRADYSIGGYANGMRDLLTYLDIPSVTVVGNSLGGGIAMQFAYQFPEMTERIVLVASGGLGRSVNPVIKALTVPGAGIALAAVSAPPVRPVVRATMSGLAASGLPWTEDLPGLAEAYEALADRRSRVAFRHVLRAAADWKGQVITMIDRAYLARSVPTMVVWGDRDLVIPVKHAYSAHELLPGSRLEIFRGSGHLPHEDDPDRFARELTDFVMDTPAATYERDGFRQLLRSGHNPRHADVDDRVVRLPEQTDAWNAVPGA
ncbi:MAG: alpha/beta hydrolase [Candidatus Nanopelagicales bacterium]